MFLRWSATISVYVADFSLQNWRNENQIAAGPLDTSDTKQLLGDLGLTDYIRESPCDIQQQQYASAVNGWVNSKSSLD